MLLRWCYWCYMTCTIVDPTTLDYGTAWISSTCFEFTSLNRILLQFIDLIRIQLSFITERLSLWYCACCCHCIVLTFRLNTAIAKNVATGDCPLKSFHCLQFLFARFLESTQTVFVAPTVRNWVLFSCQLKVPRRRNKFSTIITNDMVDYISCVQF